MHIKGPVKLSLEVIAGGHCWRASGVNQISEPRRDEARSVFALGLFDSGAVLEWQFQVHNYSVLRCSAASMSARDGARQSCTGPGSLSPRALPTASVEPSGENIKRLMALP